MAKERFELSDGVKDLLSGMGKLSAEMKDNSAKAMEYAQSMDKLAKQNTELTKLNEALSTSFSKVSNALNKASSGNDLTKYIKSQEDMVKSINRTYRQYSIQSDTIKKNQLAEELYKQVNALRAVADNVDLSNLVGNFEEVKKVISSVGSYVKSEFSVSAFKEINETIEVLEQAGLKIKNVFSTLDKGSQFYDINRELRETKEQLELINNADVSELTGKLKKLGKIAEEEFNTFLNLYNLSGSSYKFYDIFEEIRSGAITSQQAIERVKNEFDYLVVEAKSSGNQNYDILNSSAIREMVENISTLRIKVDEIMTKISNTSSEKTRMEIFDEEQFNRLLILFEKIESSLSSMKAVFVDVGDGEEFSPLLKMINNVQSSVNKLSTSVKGIGLNMNIDVGSNKEIETKFQEKTSKALIAYQRLFEHIKSTTTSQLIFDKFNDFNLDNFDTTYGKAKAIADFIERARNDSKLLYNGHDVLKEDTAAKYWNQASAAMGQATKVLNEMKASSDASPLENLFGKTDLTEVVTQLNLIVDKLGEISSTASEFKNTFANGFNVSASIEEIEKLTNRVKELEDELSKVKVSSTSPVETNISSPIKDTFQGDKIDQATTSAKELDKTLEQVDIPTDSFDDVLSKLDLTESKLKEIVKITKQSVSDSEGKFHDSYTLKDKRGSTEIYGLSSNTEKGQLLRSNIVGYDAKEIEKANKQILKSEQELQAQKDAFHKKNLTAIDLEIQKREEESKMFSSTLKAQMEERQKDISSMESSLKSFNESSKQLSEKPDDQHQFSSWKKQLEDLNIKIAEYKSKVESLSKIDIADEEQIKKAKLEIEDLGNSIKDKITSMKNVPQASRGWNQTGVDKLIQRMNDDLKKNSKYTDETKRNIQGLIDELNNIPDRPLSEIFNDFSRFKREAHDAGKEGKAFFEIFKEKVIYGGAAQLAGMVGFYDVINVFRQGFETIKEYDNALTEMNKVSKESIEILKEFQKESFDLADAVGTTASQIQNSTADFLRLGESFEQAKQSAQDANALFKVAEFDNISEATDALVAMSQAYKELDKSQINDVLNYTGNNFSISTSELASALQRSAATLKVAGNDIYEATALVTAGNAVLQDAETVGSGLKMISLRILGTEEAKNELASLGENVDDFVVQTKSKIDETVRNYTAVASNAFKGISVLDENGNYRSTYEILRDISLVYQEILEADKKAGTNRGQALLEVLAGKNRSNVAASILQSPELLTSVYEEAMKNSQGSVEKELEAQLQSIETHLNQLKNAWDELWINENNREVITFFLDLAKGILEVVDDVGVLNTAIMGIGAFAGIKNFGKTYECMVSNRNCFEYALHA